LAEVILTALVIFVILAVTGAVGNATIAGKAIGLTLMVVHLIGISLTGTSVNPARSLGPALVVGGTALSQVRRFLLAPLVGAILAAVIHAVLYPRAQTSIIVVEVAD
jgi:aquaporin Z